MTIMYMSIGFGVLQILVGLILKAIIMIKAKDYIGAICDVGIWLLTFTFIALFPYKGASGGFHLKTHIGCIVVTTLFYCVIPFISQYILLESFVKYILVAVIWTFGMFMIKLYAPADTEDVPILTKDVRKKKQIVSYITFSIALICACIIKNNTISNILILSNLLQTISITKLAYRLTNNKYGYEVYGDASI